MSGICGAWSFDGGSPDLSPTLAQLERRGPDGTHHWSDGQVALGHTSLATTPEALVEVLPLTERDSGCTITADARLDNREELIAKLELDRETRTIGDGELILRAYLKWGGDCPTHLLGDLAFAIWDPRERRLFCARDHMGMRQFHYHHAPGKLFAFATEAEAVFAHPAVPKTIERGRIADVIDCLEAVDLTSTFFEGLVRLPAAHSLTVDALGTSLRRYWQLKIDPEADPGSNEERAQKFLSIFTEAVHCRLRSCGPIGSMLSGGVDSGAVTWTAAALLASKGGGPLDTFSAVGPDASGCAETRAIRIAANTPSLRAHFVDFDALDDYRDALEHLAEFGNPFDSHMTLIRAVYLAAHRAGIRVMLDGVGGDSILNAGNRVAALLRAGQLTDAIREARAEALFLRHAVSAKKLLLAGAWSGLAPVWLRKLRRRLISHRHDRRTRIGRGLVAPALASETRLAERRAQFKDHVGVYSPLAADYRLEAITHPYLVAARERYDRVASTLAIEPRDPFMDIRLIGYCLSLPPAAVHSGGWRKLILRRAMARILPDEILWRRGKEHLGSAFTAALVERSQFFTSAELEPLSGIASDFTLARLREFPLNAMDRETRLKLVTLTNWLCRNQTDVEPLVGNGSGDVDD